MSTNGATSSDGTMTAEVAPAAPSSLPDDALRQIILLCDVTTIVRCAAVSKHLRLVLLDPGFRRELALRAAANGGFDRRLLVGVSYFIGYQHASNKVVQVYTPPSLSRPLVRLDAGVLNSSKPLVSRDGLLVLRRDQSPVVAAGDFGHGQFTYSDAFVGGFDLYVCDALTGHVTPSLPPMEINREAIFYPPALLAVGAGAGAGRSFELLVAGNSRGELLTLTFSSQDGRWSAVRFAHPLSVPFSPVLFRSTFPVVIVRTVYWLANGEEAKYEVSDDANMVIVALDADTARAAAIELPKRCITRMLSCCNHKEALQLAISPAGRLRLVAKLRDEIVMWTLSPEEEGPARRWSRQAVISVAAIDKQLPVEAAYVAGIRFRGFGERSGVVLFQMEFVGLVRLDLTTKEAVVLCRSGLPTDPRPRRIDMSGASLHEIDLATLLLAMKPF